MAYHITIPIPTISIAELVRYFYNALFMTPIHPLFTFLKYSISDSGFIITLALSWVIIFLSLHIKLFAWPNWHNYLLQPIAFVLLPLKYKSFF